MVLDQLFSGKIRVALLTKLLLNPVSKVYLRGLERDLGVSSNTVRLELNKLQKTALDENWVSTFPDLVNKSSKTQQQLKLLAGAVDAAIKLGDVWLSVEIEALKTMTASIQKKK